MAQTTATKKRPSFIWIALAGLVALCVICVVAGSVMNALGLVPTSTPSAIPTATALPSITPPPSVTPPPTETLPPTDTPPPSATLAPIVQLRGEIETVLGSGNRDIPRLTEFNWIEGEKQLLIQFAINDNFSNNLIMIGIQSDIADMLKVIAQSLNPLDYQRVTFDGTFPLSDSFGNTEEKLVVEAAYDKTTIDRINWDGFLYTNVFDIADFQFIHPALTQ